MEKEEFQKLYRELSEIIEKNPGCDSPNSALVEQYMGDQHTFFTLVDGIRLLEARMALSFALIIAEIGYHRGIEQGKALN